MATNSHGLDVNYINKNLRKLQQEADNYTPAEMARALSRLSAACTNSFARCTHCDGHKTRYVEHDASSWFCEDCNKTYKLKGE